MKLIQLRYFCSIVENGGFISASRELYVAQPALSRQMVELEAEVGVELLARGPSGTQVTEAGRRFYGHAKSILEQIQFAKQDTNNAAGKLVGDITVALPVGISGMLAASIILEVERRYPEIKVTILDSLGYEAGQMIETGKVDFGILPNVGRLQDVNLDPVLREDLFLFSRCQGGEPDYSDIRLVELAGRALVMPNRQVHVRRALEEAMIEKGHAPTIRYEQQSLLTIRSMVLAGIGATVLNWPSMADLLPGGDIDARRIIDPNLSRNISLATSRLRPQTPVAAAVYEVVRNVLVSEVQNGNWKGEIITPE
ncbi:MULTISPECIES: LysR family transcriptional regulator [unclassified Pseudophaeobacter]|uniref:LysR family transcriptional regulator n=1 Tax=unclassified Pseudophaeobacter TaxID=2637024 RepID=UPI000EFCDEDB|nr:LysR family transcriptional regulator [Pseudophaeobacter sp. EL27]